MSKFALGLCIALALTGGVAAQEVPAVREASPTLPDAPLPQNVDVPLAEFSSSQQPTQQPTPQQTQTPTPAPAPSTGTDDETPEERRIKAAEQLKYEETQRIAGIIPNFNAVNNGKAEPITPAQKFQLFFRGSVDPYQFALAGIDAILGQSSNSPKGYNEGVKGFLRRYGANYGDNFDGNFWGNAVLPSLLHQDPRYFRKGNGPVLSRLVYSISTTFRARGDNGKWQPNVSNLLGNLIGASISNLYYPNYPENEQGLYPTLRRGLSVTYQGTFGALLIEFYPDLQQHLKNGRERKLARKAEAAYDATN